MPVIVIGADTPTGRAIVDALVEPDREVRAFVTDVDTAERLKELGVKVALGDVSDDTHVEAASTNCFSAVLVEQAAFDERERAFAADRATILNGWGRAVRAVQRSIWVSAEPPARGTTAEHAHVDAGLPIDDIAEKVKMLDFYDSATFEQQTG